MTDPKPIEQEPECDEPFVLRAAREGEVYLRRNTRRLITLINVISLQLAGLGIITVGLIMWATGRATDLPSVVHDVFLLLLGLATGRVQAYAEQRAGETKE